MYKQISKNHAPLFTLALAMAACHADVVAVTGSSVTDAEDLFDETDSGPDVPTTSVSDSNGSGGDSGVEPGDFCVLNPDPAFPGMQYACSGDLSTTLVFDYYGDADIPVDTLLPCSDQSDVDPKGPGYLYTCFVESELKFGPDAANNDVEACCVDESPDEAVDAFCRIDAAEEVCVGLAEQLDSLRKQLPVIPKLKTINAQLLNLNEFVAEAGTQTECAKTFAKQFIDTGDIQQSEDTATWQPMSKAQLDPEDGWSWFRNLNVNVGQFALNDSESTGLRCVDADSHGLEEGDLQGGQVEISDGEARTVSGVTSGRVSLRRTLCSAKTCPVELRAFDVTVADFQLGIYGVSEIRARLGAPVKGDLTSSRVRFAGSAFPLAISFKATSRGEVLFGGEPITVELRATGDVVASLTADSRFNIDSLKVANWPIEMKLTTSPAAISSVSMK